MPRQRSLQHKLSSKGVKAELVGSGLTHLRVAAYDLAAIEVDPQQQQRQSRISMVLSCHPNERCTNHGTGEAISFQL